MREIDKNLIECIEMCSYIEKKTGEKNVKKRMETDLCAYMLYVCGKNMNKKQADYINKLLNLSIKTGDSSLNINQDKVLEKMDILNLFLIADTCFGTSDVKYGAKKTEALIQLFETAGEDLCRLSSDKEAPATDGRMTVYLQKMNAVSLSTPVSENMNGSEKTEDDGKTVEELVAEFNELTGLQSVKNEINGLINLVKVSKMRKERGFKETTISKHMVFTGNPGTGKTTVARLLSNIYHKLGVLSKGQLVEVDRSGLVAGYTGQTAIKTDKVIQEAKGGILFIDEAYTLTEDKGEGDFGQEAVDTILKAMEDNRDDLVVIVAGYPDLMAGFLSSNPGLKSRFNKFIDFEDYNSEELLKIFKGMCNAMDYKIDEECEKQLKEKIKKMLEEKNASFANARTMRNMLEYAVMQQATRIVEEKDLSDEELLSINYNDVKDYQIQ